ncbi:MAG: ABC transporter ATP-binding protein/permease [Acholeplasmatales bacterium]|jgi:ATP-binding cassette subfamily B protein|nr:ABC transporter ATP-binding protein/permease [Acholeplasmatales bacterium]
MIFGKHFFKYYIKYGIFFLIGIGILIYIDFIQVKIPIHIGQIVDVLKIEGDTMKTDVNIILLEIVKIVPQIVLGRCLWRFCIFSTSRQIEYELRNVMFIHATFLDQEFYHKNKVGGLMTHFINDLAAVRESFGPGILTLVDGVFLTVFALRSMYVLNLTLSYFVTGLLVVLVILIFLQGIVMKRKFKARQDSFENLSDFVNESFSGIQVVKAYVKEESELNTFNEKSKDFKDKHITFVKNSVKVQIIVSIVTNIISLLILGLGAFLIIIIAKNEDDDAFTGGQLTAYLALFFELLWPLTAITRFMNINSQGQASAKRINTFLNYEPSVKDSPLVNKDIQLEGNIKFKNLSFHFPSSTALALENISFEIKEGEMVGIIGKTGSGKSSLVDLLLRIYNVDKNMLFIDDHDIMDLSISSVRELVGYVPQDNFLFSDTILSNIAFSSPNDDLDEAINAAKLSDVHDNIMEFGEQYNTMLGERGVTVSGGQKQRIAIARAILKDPKILVLDDSVSAVDTATEADIINNLFKIRKNKTTIIIAHRISTIKRLDKIILIDDHKVCGIGTYDDLLKNNDLFKDIVRRQELEGIINL